MELLVVLTILFVLMGIVLAVAGQAQSGQAAQQTRSLIARLDAIIAEQYGSYANRYVSGSDSERAAAIRRMISGDMPDSWADVAHMAANPSQFTSGPQKAYIAMWNAMAKEPTDRYGDAECLFMIVMQGGIANCIDCGALRNVEKGDKDNDGCPEFWDGWEDRDPDPEDRDPNNPEPKRYPIRFVLWPAGFQLPPGSSSAPRYFSSTAPFLRTQPAPAPGGMMRPLIFSGGPDGKNSIAVNGGSNLQLGSKCGDPSSSPFGGLEGTADNRADNITNFDAEVAP